MLIAQAQIFVAEPAPVAVSSQVELLEVQTRKGLEPVCENQIVVPFSFPKPGIHL